VGSAGPQDLMRGAGSPDRRTLMGRRAVFLDKDGTVVVNVAYNVDPARLTLTHRAGDGLRLLQNLGYELVVVSNQSGVARGYFAERGLATVQGRLAELLWAHGVRLTDSFYCPHHPDGSVATNAFACPCRKPEPGLLRTAAARHGIDLDRSWMVGDILDDVEAGRRAGCATILVNSGGETEWVVTPLRCPQYVVSDLWVAAQTIVSVDGISAQATVQKAAL
jgi:histidinol-phosphate phosphatase family protein